MGMKKGRARTIILWAVNALAILVILAACSGKKEVVEEAKDPVAVENGYSQLIQDSCLTCHANPDGKIERIADVRKTTEGWELTISRMQNTWGVNITDEQKRQIIKELSYTNGLAPEETEKSMNWITRKGTSMSANPDGVFTETCLKCHASDQPMAQRRTADEWDKLKDFHIAYYPTTIYQLRLVDWDEEAGKAIEYLKENYGYTNPAYEEWKKNPKTYNPEGSWKIVGTSPTYGMYTGTSTFTKKGDDFYEERSITINGKEVPNNGTSILYGGYSLRTSLDGEERFRGYLNFDKAGKKITGSRVKVGDTGIYADEVYYANVGTAILDLWPRSVQKGLKTEVHIAGVGLPEGIQKEQLKTNGLLEVNKIVKQQGDDIWVEVTPKSEARKTSLDAAELSIDGVEGTLSVQVYDKVDLIKVTPEQGLARYGEENQRKSVQFEATAYKNGKDGKPNTNDDILLGPVAATWSMTNQSEELDDTEFIGTLDQKTGLFTPAKPGPNPNREWSTNNAGGVHVHAVYTDPMNGQALKADGFLLSTVPDFVKNVH